MALTVRVQVNATFPRVSDGVRCWNDVPVFSGIGLCNAGSGKAEGERCSGVFQKYSDETAACRGLNRTDTIPWSTFLVEQAIWTSLASQRTEQLNQRTMGKRLGFHSGPKFILRKVYSDDENGHPG